MWNGKGIINFLCCAPLWLIVSLVHISQESNISEGAVERNVIFILMYQHDLKLHALSRCNINRNHSQKTDTHIIVLNRTPYWSIFHMSQHYKTQYVDWYSFQAKCMYHNNVKWVNWCFIWAFLSIKIPDVPNIQLTLQPAVKTSEV